MDKYSGKCRDFTLKNEGSTGLGLSKGWELVSEDDSTQLSAEFQSNSSNIYDRFSLESPTVAFESPVFALFERSMVGFKDSNLQPAMKFCLDALGERCLWQNPLLYDGHPNLKDDNNESKWHKELVRLPKGAYKVYITVEVLEATEGSVHLKYIQLYHDHRMKQPLC